MSFRMCSGAGSELEVGVDMNSVDSDNETKNGMKFTHGDVTRVGCNDERVSAPSDQTVHPGHQVVGNTLPVLLHQHLGVSGGCSGGDVMSSGECERVSECVCVCERASE